MNRMTILLKICLAHILKGSFCQANLQKNFFNVILLNMAEIQLNWSFQSACGSTNCYHLTPRKQFGKCVITLFDICIYFDFVISVPKFALRNITKDAQMLSL